MSEEKHWLVRPATIKKLWIFLLTSLVITVLLEFFVEHKVHFGIEASFGFSAWFGFLSCLLMVIGAKILGFNIKRPDTYYQNSYNQENKHNKESSE